ncbi:MULTISPECIES: hypothetical protein [unclassified Streptomyces]
MPVLRTVLRPVALLLTARGGSGSSTEDKEPPADAGYPRTVDDRSQSAP